MDLKALYKSAAEQANKDGIDSGNEDDLVQWIWANCKYHPDNEWYLLLGIGSALADLQAQAEGYKNDVHRAFEIAKAKTS